LERIIGLEPPGPPPADASNSPLSAKALDSCIISKVTQGTIENYSERECSTWTPKNGHLLAGCYPQTFALAPRPTSPGKRPYVRCQIVARAFPHPSADQATALKAGRLIPLGARGLEGARPLGQINFGEAAAWGNSPAQAASARTGSRRLSLLQGAQRPAFLGRSPSFSYSKIPNTWSPHA
jgi:hypothetical protein